MRVWGASRGEKAHEGVSGRCMVRGIRGDMGASMGCKWGCEWEGCE